MLEQVVINLCVNARDAMPEGGRLCVETRDADLDEFAARQADVRPGPYVARVLAHTGGNKQAAARLLGVDRKTLERMIKRHNLSIQNSARTRPGG